MKFVTLKSKWEPSLMFLSNPNFALRSEAWGVLEHVESLSLIVRILFSRSSSSQYLRRLAFACIGQYIGAFPFQSHWRVFGCRPELRAHSVELSAGCLCSLQVLCCCSWRHACANALEPPVPSKSPRDESNGSHIVLIVANKCLNDLMWGRRDYEGEREEAAWKKYAV